MMCMHYCKFSDHTINDKFPVIDELRDELHGGQDIIIEGTHPL